MCGILGFIGSPWGDQAATALLALRSRGPDEQSITDLGEAILGHARLAVIDLAGGHQPMSTADNRYHMIFNGEIYNYAQLRDDLIAIGHKFSSNSDTEVLLKGYVTWGEEILERVNGMFAFAIWDSTRRILFAARDNLGIKPFVYSTAGNGFTFASTLAPFLALKGFPRNLDAEALRDYLAFQTPLAPHTFLADVHQLPPAHCLLYKAESKQLIVRRWWSIPKPKSFVEDRETLISRTEQALRDSVRRQMVADVPLGAFLSGGVDSSLMVRYMAETCSVPLQTFSMRFADSDFDESAHALAVAEIFGCNHEILDAPDVSSDDFQNAITDLDQPLADPSYVMTYALSRLTRNHVAVAISGDGGDELFGGYPRYLITENCYPQRLGQQYLRNLVETGLLPSSLMGKSLWGQDRLLYQRGELGPWRVGRKSIVQYLSPEIVFAAKPEETLGLWRRVVAELGGKMDSDTLMRADLWTYLSENCLVKTDRASMAHGLEIRVPMLDRQVQELALALPAEVHLYGGEKSLLTELARRGLPEQVWNRPKHGFSVPLGKLFQTNWRKVCEEVLDDCESIAPFLNAVAVRTLWRNVLQGRGSRRLAYTFIVLLVWLRVNKINH